MPKFVTTFILASFMLGTAAEGSPKACLDGKRQALISSHFTGPLVCSKVDATFTLAGRIAGGKYSVYDYRFRYLPKKGGVMHGGQKIVIFREDKYRGQYALSPPPYADVRVSGTHVIIKMPDTGETVQLDFAGDFPKEFFIDGEMQELFR